MEVCGAEEEAISRLNSTGNARRLNLIVSFGLFLGYVDNKKNIEYHQIYPLNQFLSYRNNLYLVSKDHHVM